MRILFVAISNSIHTVRWIRQLTGRGWDLHLFPSWAPYGHPEHRDITIHAPPRFVPDGLSETVTLSGKWPAPFGMFAGLARRLFPGWLNEPSRLARLIRELRPTLIHSLEIQHGGYLTLEARKLLNGDFPPWIVTDWGNDT